MGWPYGGIGYWEGGGDPIGELVNRNERGAMRGGLDTGEERGWPYEGIRCWQGEGVAL